MRKNGMNTKATPDSPLTQAEEVSNRKLDEKLMELQSLFEVSQMLNSSLNLKTILDNLLLTPMGKMMISRGIVLLYKNSELIVETLKGLPQNLVGKKISFQKDLTEIVFFDTLKPTEQNPFKFFLENKIIVLFPIRSSDKTLGYIGFGKKLIHESYSKSDIEYLKSLINIAGTSIENGLMVMQLHDVNRRLDKKIQELNTLFEIGKELNSTLDKEKILNLLSYAIMGEMLINRCLIFLKEDEKKILAMIKGLKDEEDIERFHNERFLEAIFNLSEPLNLNKDTVKNNFIADLKKSGFPAVVPMRLQNETKGVLAIGSKITNNDFMQDELEFLSTLGNEALICLENVRLFEEKLEKQRMEEELALAREIQQKLLPTECPITENYEITGINISSLHVSGDYFDCIRLDDNRLCLAIADVSGKGTPASLLMANLQAVLNALIDSDEPLKKVTAKINNIIHKNTNYDRFITFFIGILDTDKNIFTYVNAGHNPPMLVENDGTIKYLEEGGLLLGMMPDIPYEESTVKLTPGEWIIMFTDGVTEAKDQNDEDFEEFRLKEVILKNRSATAENMKEKILTAVKEFTGNVPQSDDITLLIVKAR